MSVINRQPIHLLCVQSRLAPSGNRADSELDPVFPYGYPTFSLTYCRESWRLQVPGLNECLAKADDWKP